MDLKSGYPYWAVEDELRTIGSKLLQWNVNPLLSSDDYPALLF